MEQPLEQDLETLLALHISRYDRIYPGHGTPITDPNPHPGDDHHHERQAWRVLATLDRRGAATPWDLGRDLFGGLFGYHAFVGPEKMAVHLDYLEARGLVMRKTDGYRVTATGTERLDDCTGEQLELVTRTADGEPRSVR